MYLEAEGITLQMTDEAKSHLQLGKVEFVPLTGNEGGYVNADVGGYQILLNYRGQKENFQTVSIADILENRISPDLMRDRIVLIGATGQSANDLFFTPYSQNTIGSRQQTPGVIIHANIASQIISGAMAGRPLIKAIDGRPLIPFIDRINQLSWLTIWVDPVEWLWIVVWCLIGAGGSWKLQQLNQFADRIFPRWMVVGFGTFFMGSILVVGSYGAFLANWWLPVVSPMAALIGSSMAITLYQTWELQRYNADLEILLETTTAHSDAIEEELHQQAEEAARESERRLAQFLEAVPVGVAVLDASGKTYYLNQRAQQLMGKGVVPDTFAEQFAEVYQFYIAGTDQLYPAELLPVVQALMGESATADDIEIHQGDQIIPIEAWGIPMEPAIVEHDGFIDKYIGDAIMALFNGSADDAVRAGIDMLNRLTDYNKTRQRPDRPPIQIGIGINTGSLMLGTVGGHNRMDGTVISDAVNLAARLEQLTKEYGVSLLISHHTFLQLNHPVEYAFRIIGQVQVKGKSEMVSVFEIFEADPPELRSVKLMTKPDFEKALFLYSKHLFKEAAQIFQECLPINPVDQVAQIYLEACQKQGED
ncbi:MAG: CHASE2 domain-containing protein [Coleofasciculus sp. F4-SAH-05]